MTLSIAPTPAPAPPARRRGAWTRRLGTASGWALVAALVALNGWWAWGNRGVIDLKVIDQWIRLRQVGKAETALRQRLFVSPHDAEARIRLAQVAGQRRNYVECARQLELVPAWSPRKHEARFFAAQSFKQLDRMREAEAAWKELTANDPLHPVSEEHFSLAARELIGLYVLENRIDEARATVWRAYDAANPVDHANILVMRMRLELERIAHEEAVEKLRRILLAGPDDWEARRALALEEELTGNPEAADAHIARCIAARPQATAGYSTWLTILQQRGDRDAIAAALAKIPAGVPPDIEVWKCRALLAEAAGDLKTASAAYDRALELVPNDPELLYKSALVEQRLNHTDQAARRIAASQRLRKAEGSLDRTYTEYAIAASRSGPDDPAYREAALRLADVCAQLGWEREATAWRRVVGES